jgi:glycosyltransferase involved in cell wall biosynthesis
MVIIPAYLKTITRDKQLMNKDKKFAVVTCCLDDWGGSEELWAKSIPFLIKEDIKNIIVFKHKINHKHPEFIKLSANNLLLKELSPRLKFVRNVFSKLTDSFYHIGDKLGLLAYQWNKPAHALFRHLKAERPNLVLISQGINFDGLAFAYQCLKLNIPYIIVCHKAVNFFWPQAGDRDYMKETLIKARKCLFVSEHNRKLTEEQFGIRLVNSDIVINPVKTSVSPLPYPSTLETYKLACVGRLFVIDKGQDILIRILAQPKWKERNIMIDFIGKGPDKEALMEMASLLEVQNISFSGFNDDIKDIWATHHALILPSRSEGLPLTIVEAMSFGRIVIATNAGGNNEIIQNEVTGFIGEANESDLDKTLEIAWNRRTEWEAMGLQAAEYITHTIPKNPEKKFADLIIETIANV